MQFGKIESYILMGGGVLLTAFAKKLKDDGHQVTVFTSPRQLDENFPTSKSTLKQALEAASVDYMVSENINNDEAVISKINDNTLGVSLGAPWVFRKKLIDSFNGRLLNVHGERLPKDRGSGFSWHILRGNRLGCCAIHQVDVGIDSGPIVKYKEFIYPNHCRTPLDYFQVSIQENEEFLGDFFEELAQGNEFRQIDQPEYLSLYWPRLSTEDNGYLNWDWDLPDIERFICAFDEPYKGASTFINGSRVYLKSCFVDVSDGFFHPYQTGIVFRKSNHLLFVATSGGSLVVGSVTDQEGQAFHADIKVGDRFYTPTECLEKAKQYRAFYTPLGLQQQSS